MIGEHLTCLLESLDHLGPGKFEQKEMVQRTEGTIGEDRLSAA